MIYLDLVENHGLHEFSFVRSFVCLLFVGGGGFFTSVQFSSVIVWTFFGDTGFDLIKPVTLFITPSLNIRFQILWCAQTRPCFFSNLFIYLPSVNRLKGRSFKVYCIRL